MSEHERRTRTADHETEDDTGEMDLSGIQQPAPHPPGRTAGSLAPDPPNDPRDTWQPSASFGRVIGILLLAFAVIVTLTGVWQSLAVEGGARVVWLIVVVVGIAGGAGTGYLLHGLSTLRYVFGPDYLIVEWLRERRAIRFADIQDVVFEPSSPVAWARWERFWPGYHVSTVRTPDGVWRSYATQPPRRRVRIVTPDGVVAISPERPVLFLSELERRATAVVNEEPEAQPVVFGPVEPDVDRAAPPEAVLDHSRLQPPVSLPEQRAPDNVGSLVPPRPGWRYSYDQLFRKDLLGDQVTSNLVAVGLLLPIVMAAYLYSQYEGLPGSVPLHWDATGQVDQVGAPRDLWRFPLIAALIFLANTALATLVVGIDRFLARLLTAATPVAQIIAFVALVRLAG